MNRIPQPGTFYRHFKNKLYQVIAVATHSETGEKMVIYRALYGERGLWVRPAAMWDEVIERDGRQYRRFTYVADDEATARKLLDANGFS
mgnify:CR=1 FL=1